MIRARPRQRRMLRRLALRAWGLVVLALSTLPACNPESSGGPVQTAAQLGTQITDIRRQSTSAAERLQITLDDAQEKLTLVQDNQDALRGTLSARGYEPPANLSGDTPLANSSTQLSSIPIITPPIAARNPTAAGALVPSLSDFRLGPEIGADDCIAIPQSRFPATAATIYTSARARNLPPATRLRTRWFFAGELRIAFDYTPGYAIADHCVWFFIDPRETPFTPGEWLVQWELAEQTYPSLPFTVFSSG